MRESLIIKLIKLIEVLNSSNENKGKSEKDYCDNQTEECRRQGETVLKERPIVAFANNCIIYGYSSATALGDITINKAQYCYYYAKPDSDEKKGFMALAKYGPAKNSKVSSPVDQVTVNACCIIKATAEAVNVWENSEWKS